MIHNYLFDLYGTLVNIHTEEAMPSLWRRMALFLSLQGASYGPAELKTAYKVAIEREIDRLWALSPGLAREHVEPDILRVFASLYAQKGRSFSEERLRDTAVLFRTLSMRRLALYQDAVQVLRTLRQRGKGVYLLSNAQAAFTVPELHKLGLAPLFDGVVLSSDAGVKKPDRAIFEHILRKYNLGPEACVMVGNDETADMLGAWSAGIAGVYIHTKQSPDRRGILPPNCREIQRLSELL